MFKSLTSKLNNIIKSIILITFTLILTQKNTNATNSYDNYITNYNVEAIIINKIINHITINSTNYISLCIYNDQPILQYIQNIDNKKYNLLQINDYQNLDDCDIIYLSKEQDIFIKNFLSRTTNQLLLTNEVNYLKKGFSLSFTVSNSNKVAIYINKKSLNNRSFQINRSLLSLSKIIK
jgi:hypothetical protein